jgi:hypothetical protein
MKKKRLSPAEKAHLKRKEIYGKIRNSVLILDCTPKSAEKCSEGEFLEKYLQILNRQLRADKKSAVDIYLMRVQGPKRLKTVLKNAGSYTIHLSSHGNVDKKTKETYLDLSHGRLYASELNGLWGDIDEKERPLVIILSACHAGHRDLIRNLSEHGCRYCIAPVRPTNWEHAAIFSTFFYTYLLLRRNRPVTAYHKTIRSLPALTGKWTMFDKGKEIPEKYRSYHPSN